MDTIANNYFTPIYDNTAGGFNAMHNNEASYNTAFGSNALPTNTLGYFLHLL